MAIYEIIRNKEVVASLESENAHLVHMLCRENNNIAQDLESLLSFRIKGE